MSDITRPTLTVIPNELRRLRLQKPYSRSELAVLAGLSTRRVEQLENNPSGITPKTARLLASALGCDLNAFTEIVEAAS